MDFLSVFHDVWERLINYSRQNNTSSMPTFNWCADTLCTLLLQYPAGLTQAVLLTELESKWRLYLRRGENAGKLLQILTSMQLSSGDVLVGDVTTIGHEDSGRYLMRSADGGKVELLLHEQFADFIGFAKHEGTTLFVPTATVDATAGMAGKTVRLTQCNLLNSPPLPMMLLPTPAGVIELNSEEKEDFKLLAYPLTFIHNDTFGQLQLLSQPHMFESTLAALEANSSMMLGVYAMVLSISDTLEYPGKRSNTYRTVKLQVPRIQLVAPPARGENYVGSQSESFQYLYLILYDAQTAYADLISTGDVLYIYRPILTANRDDPWLFGRVQAGSQSHAAFAYQDVLRVAPPLMADYGDILCDEDDSLSKEFQRNTSSSSGKSVTNNILRSPLKARDRKTCATVHLVLGSISCLVLVKDSATKLHSSVILRNYSSTHASFSQTLEFSDDHSVISRDNDKDTAKSDSVNSNICTDIICHPTYSSILKKYSLRADENGDIDTSKSHEPIAFGDYIPGLLNVTVFARVLAIVQASTKGDLYVMWLLALPTTRPNTLDSEALINEINHTTDTSVIYPPPILYLKCHPNDLCATDRKCPQAGQLVLVKGLRVESVEDVGTISSLSLSPLPFCVSKMISKSNVLSDQTYQASQAQQLNQHAHHQPHQQRRVVVEASIIPYEHTCKYHCRGIINISAIASLATSPGLFKPIHSFGDLSSLVERGKGIDSQVVVLCTIAFSKRIENITSFSVSPSLSSLRDESEGRKKQRISSPNTTSSVLAHLHEVVLVPGQDAQLQGREEATRLCACNCCLDQVPHVHAIVAESTVSLAASVDIINIHGGSRDRGNSSNCDRSDGKMSEEGGMSEFHYSRNKDYVVSMSRVDDVLTRQIWPDSNYNNNGACHDNRGPVYQIDCIADNIST